MHHKFISIFLLVAIAALSGIIYPKLFKPKADLSEIYEQSVAGKFQNSDVSNVISILGNPDSRNIILDNEILQYGPNLDKLMHAKVKSVIGITFRVNKGGRITECVGIYKD
jgi:hypothetical protein